jgi:hypothetical protein
MKYLSIIFNKKRYKIKLKVKKARMQFIDRTSCISFEIFNYILHGSMHAISPFPPACKFLCGTQEKLYNYTHFAKLTLLSSHYAFVSDNQVNI